MVTDRAHAPIRGLQKDDFEVFEDGRPVEIATFVAIDLPADPPDAQLSPPNLSYSTVGSNDYPHDGRAGARRLSCQVSADGTSRELSRESRGAAEFTTPSGQVYAMPLALGTMTAGDYRLKVEAVLGRSKSSRELPFTVVQ